MSTPARPGSTGLERQTVKDLKKELRQETSGKLLDDISVEHFLQHVFGLGAETRNQLLSLQSIKKLDPTALAEYKHIVDTKAAETKMYGPFGTISETLLRDVLKELGELGDDTTDLPLRWAQTFVPAEVKVAKPKDKPESAGDPFSSTSLSTPVSSSSRTTPNHSIPDEAGTSHSVDAPGTRTTSGKRKRGATDIGGDDTKKFKVNTMGEDELQLAIYALECMAVPTRYYTTGILLIGFTISLWYYDRAAIIRTRSFDFHDSPEYLGLILYAMSHATLQQAGFDPHLHKLPPPADAAIEKVPGGATVEKSFDITTLTQLDIPPKTYENLYIKLPSKIENKPPAVFKLIGDDALYKYRGLIGRGTMVYHVSQLDDNNGWRNDLILKLSWQIRVRTPEGNIIKILREKIPAFKDHLPDVKYSALYSSKDDLKLPRTQMEELKIPPKFEERDLHVLSTTMYKKLWEVKSIEEFKRVFIDCVECLNFRLGHYHAYEEGKVLHRDLSENNLMAWYPNSGDVKGILNDWDMASKLDEKGHIPPSGALHRTGTVPFMARDLLKKNPPPHLYRHELESWLYILVWAAAYYKIKDNDSKNKRARKPKPSLKNWNNSEIDTVRGTKNDFITTGSVAQDVYEELLPAFDAVISEWIEPLRKMFRRAHMSSEDASDNGDASYDYETCNGELTFQNFMAIIKVTPRNVHLPSA
ncbi:hypothetical protein BDQ12DRAFT_667335 [Crucibulum laeve]|uniref:Fungal-type protein kinase domain-containing protein n=1 Tax=Crucibulum laeve TaxID=68775 RepID=A0A5C3LYD4_9AGAR|nr:hypothetical protein BDQ12DRAFT_667335 [Crucibulum laeve]